MSKEIIDQKQAEVCGNQFEQLREQAARIVEGKNYPASLKDIADAIRALPLPEAKNFGWIQFVDGRQTQNFARDEAELEQMKEICLLFAVGQDVKYVPVFSDVPDAEALRKENERLHKEVATLKVQKIHISAAQLRMAREFVFSDEDQDESEQIARIAYLPANLAPIGDNNVQMRAGLYVCDDEYPEEGWMALFDDADNQPEAAKQAFLSEVRP